MTPVAFAMLAMASVPDEGVQVSSPHLGRILGMVSGDDAEVFLGLPYAKPPVGDLRFAPSQLWDAPYRDDGSAYDATNFGAPCFQSSGYWNEEPFEHPQYPPFVPSPSEDCLFANVYRPRPRLGNGSASATASSLLPVMVWVHGGGFCGGAGSLKTYNGTRLAAEQRVIVVTLNYRLGPLGFLAHPELKRKYGATGGMNGIADQLTALRWVQRNIGSFGGDPDAVTLFGESSGGVSVCLLNTSPKAKGLFRRAAIHSGPCIVPSEGWGPATVAYGYDTGAKLLAALNATSLDELHSMPAQRLQWDNVTLGSDNFAGYSFDDGGVLSEWPAQSYSTGRLNAEALIIGHTSKDGTAAFYASSPLANSTADDWKAAMIHRWGSKADAVMRQYSLERFANASHGPPVTQSYIEADADERVVCPLRRMLQMASTASNAPSTRQAGAGTAAGRGGGASSGAVYAFLFSHLGIYCDAGWDLQVLPWWGSRSGLIGSGWASHGSDNHFLFGTTRGANTLANPPFPRQECPMDLGGVHGERELSQYMGARWAAFASAAPPWDSFRAGAAEPTRTMRLETGGGRGIVRDWKAGDCAFWSSI
jgi:carboxylesterase type B